MAGEPSRLANEDSTCAVSDFNQLIGAIVLARGRIK